MKTRLSVVLVAALLMLPVFAQAQQAFDANGNANIPGTVGDDLTMYSVVYGINPPLPLDFDNFEYTMVITDLELTGSAGISTFFADGLIAIYEDNATVADFANPATFVDGTPILTGVIHNLTRNQIGNGGSASSQTVDWTGGTRLDEIAPEDQVDWVFLTGINVSLAAPGYSEHWDCKAEPEEPIVGNEQINWGDLKAKANY